MIERPAQRTDVWLSTDRVGTIVRYDAATGRVVERLRVPGDAPTTAGVAYRVHRGWAAVYVEPATGGLLVQVGPRTLPLDGGTHAVHRTRFGRLVSELLIARPGEPGIRLRQRTVARALLRRFDPTYDELDESVDDHLADIADVVERAERRAWFAHVKDPHADPSR